MSIVQKYQFGGSDGLAAALNLENMATIMTSTFQMQMGGGSLTDGIPNQLKHLGVPAGLVLSTIKEIDNDIKTHTSNDVMPDKMFDHMLHLVGNKMKPVFTKRAQTKQKGGKLTRRK